MYIKIYFILAHKNPAQLHDLISLLDDGKSLFFIHLDKKVNINLFFEIIQKSNCFFIEKRERSRWGGFAIVQGTLNGMSQIRGFMNQNYPNHKYHCVLLSGEDLPLKNNKEIHRFLQFQQDFSFIHYWKLPYDKWWDGGLFRFKSLYLFDYNKHPEIHKWMNKMIRKLRLFFLIPSNRIEKQFPDVDLFGSSQWMVFSQRLLSSIIEMDGKQKMFKNYFKYVLLPDELYIITLINYYIKEELEFIKNYPVHLIRFIGNRPNPEYLSIDDLKRNSKETTLFARKFDKKVNIDSIDYIKMLIEE